MAKIGMKYWGWAPFAGETTTALPTYSSGFKLGESVKADLKITNAEGKLYGDDQLCEDIKEFSSGALTGEVDELALAKQATLYGATITDGELGNGAGDVAPFGGAAYMQILSKSGTKRYRTFFYPKVKAVVPDESAVTKGDSFTLGTDALSFIIFPPKYGKWRYVKDHVSEDAAQSYIDGKLSIATWYDVNMLVSGASTGESAVLSAPAVASGSSATITITGTVTALYDNGTESKASISNGVYTLSNVVADHDIAVIF